ncbi:MAG: hypothetical protein ABI317_07050 [Gaiellales bacterium]
MSRRRTLVERGDARALRSMASVLADGETIELGVSGSFGTLSSGGYGSSSFSLGDAIDPFDIFLTDRRLVAARRGLYRRSGPTTALTCDRGAAHVGALSRHALFDRVTLVFKDQTLALTVYRRDRERVDRLARALDREAAR